MDHDKPSRALAERAPTAAEVGASLRFRNAVPGRVSVIIPVFQGERFVVGAIRSALRQTYADLEILLVNDGSTDGTAGLLEREVDPRVTVLQQTNQGLSAARNLALARASGEYIALLDADDRWLPKKLEIEIRTLKAATNPVGVVYSWYYAVDDRGRLLHRSPPNRFSGDVFETMLGTDDFILPSASFFHRKVFETVGGFDIGSHHEDRVFFLRAAKTFPIWPTQRHLVVYLQSVDGLGRRNLTDFDAARRENLSIVECLRAELTPDQTAVLAKQQLRSLYLRFLMYGYNRSATRMLSDVNIPELRNGVKGWVAWLYAKAGVNLMWPLRNIIQGANRTLGQRRWRQLLLSENLDLDYRAK